MTPLERLLKAEGVQGGTIHTYEHAFTAAMERRVRLDHYEAADFTILANDLLARDKLELASLASRASVAHLDIAKAKGEDAS